MLLKQSKRECKHRLRRNALQISISYPYLNPKKIPGNLRGSFKTLKIVSPIRSIFCLPDSTRLDSRIPRHFRHLAAFLQIQCAEFEKTLSDRVVLFKGLIPIQSAPACLQDPVI